MNLNQYYKRIGAILGGSAGVAYAIIPVGDTAHESGGFTTVTTVGSGALNGLTFTYSEARTSFDSPTLYTHTGVPDVPFNGTDEEADTPDADAWSRGDGSNDSAFSIGCWLNITNTAAGKNFFSKRPAAGNREWFASINADETFTLRFEDSSAAVDTFRTSDAAVTVGSYTFLVATYDGGGGATAANGITLYENGAVIASTATNNASYVAMENLTAVVALGSASGGGNFYSGRVKGGPLGPFFVHRELPAHDILQLYRVGLEAQKRGATNSLRRRVRRRGIIGA